MNIKKNAGRLTTMAITKSKPFNSDNGHCCNTGFYFSLNFIFFTMEYKKKFRRGIR